MKLVRNCWNEDSFPCRIWQPAYQLGAILCPLYSIVDSVICGAGFCWLVVLCVVGLIIAEVADVDFIVDQRVDAVWFVSVLAQGFGNFIVPQATAFVYATAKL